MSFTSNLKFWGSLGLLTSLCSVPFMSTDAEGARETLEKAKYTEIKITGVPLSDIFFPHSVCRGYDLLKTGFEARDPQGRQQSGVVCDTPKWLNVERPPLISHYGR